MKLFILITSIFFISIHAFSQDYPSDIIYPVSGEDSITESEILKIRNWNTIIFEKDDFQDTVLAIAAVKNGRFIDFRTRKEIKTNAYPSIFLSQEVKETEKGYEYYQLEYQKAEKQRKSGSRSSLIGAFLGATTYFVMLRNNIDNKPIRYFIPAIYIGGGVLFNLGTPLWISGSIKAKKSEDAMFEQEQKGISMNVGVTGNGIGLILKF